MLPARYSRVLLNPRFVALLYAVLTLIVTAQHYLKGPQSYDNYKIFTWPFYHLLAGRDLYAEYPELYSAPFKYSPTFALVMGALAVLPDWLGLLLWNVLNNVVLFTAGRRLFPDARRSMLFLLLVLVDMMTALHNSQSNALLLGLMLWTYIHLEREKTGWAAVCVALAFFLKIYGLGIGLLFLLYPKQLARGLALGLAATVVLAAAPLVVVSGTTLAGIYQSWYTVVSGFNTAVQLSLMGVLDTWLGISVWKPGVQAVGLLLLLLPLALYWRQRQHPDLRRLYVALIPVFLVVFNQAGESPMYIMPVAGFMFWWLHYRHTTPLATPLLVLVLLFTTFASTDLYPHSLRSGFFDTYKIKAAPMILVWALIQSQLLLFPRWRDRLAAASAAEAAGAEPVQQNIS
ncbi:DUF2029 domain-containing protein [Microvirga sp. STR05]|uniref:DUF2029 domain-containing protein n=1 Tax=Hymenobacter duratus TaxID=2771356 RepID=A0ABR8JGD6_9BACT|nr:glycosyltransferase family 87 protein [Hymenobacter duratus]MBD2715920.1 DUF2029 domain-containing protein [Hymenobacter duratus]MBR7950834.1 DUF2029 domain-containing protein [Microvirga sp. STR05]